MPKRPVLLYEKSRTVQCTLTSWLPVCECGCVPGFQNREQGTATSEHAFHAQDQALETFIKLGESVPEAQRSWPFQEQERKPLPISTLMGTSHQVQPGENKLVGAHPLGAQLCPVPTMIWVFPQVISSASLLLIEVISVPSLPPHTTLPLPKFRMGAGRHRMRDGHPSEWSILELEGTQGIVQLSTLIFR